MKTIVTIPCKTIRAMAREMLRGKYWNCVLVVLACHLIAEAPARIASALTDNEYILTMVELAAFVVEVSLTLCSTRYYLMTFRGQDTSLDTFTAPLRLTWKAVLMEIISYIQIFLWSLLFIIPGIICAIKHAQNFNAMIDNPEFSSMECIHRSHEIMEGNVWKFIKLDLSFIGWMFLASLPGAVYQYMYGPKIDYIYFSDNYDFEQLMSIFRHYSSELAEFNEMLIPTLLGLLTIFVTAYISVTHAAFYDLAAGNLVVQDGEASEEITAY